MRYYVKAEPPKILPMQKAKIQRTNDSTLMISEGFQRQSRLGVTGSAVLQREIYGHSWQFWPKITHCIDLKRALCTFVRWLVGFLATVADYVKLHHIKHVNTSVPGWAVMTLKIHRNLIQLHVCQKCLLAMTKIRFFLEPIWPVYQQFDNYHLGFESTSASDDRI